MNIFLFLSYNEGASVGYLNHAGGFIGCLASSGNCSFNNCAFNGTIIGEDVHTAAGFIAYIEETMTTININNCTVAGVIGGCANIGGFIGHICPDITTYLYCDSISVGSTRAADGSFVESDCIFIQRSDSTTEGSDYYLGGFVGYGGDCTGFLSMTDCEVTSKALFKRADAAVKNRHIGGCLGCFEGKVFDDTGRENIVEISGLVCSASFSIDGSDSSSTAAAIFNTFNNYRYIETFDFTVHSTTGWSSLDNIIAYILMDSFEYFVVEIYDLSNSISNLNVPYIGDSHPTFYPNEQIAIYTSL